MKSRQLRRQNDEQEEDLTRERNKVRALQRELDETREAHDTLERELKNLRSAASSARRTTLAPSNRRFGSMSTIGRPIGSSDNLNRDDNESIGTDGSLLE